MQPVQENVAAQPRRQQALRPQRETELLLGPRRGVDGAANPPVFPVQHEVMVGVFGRRDRLGGGPGFGRGPDRHGACGVNGVRLRGSRVSRSPGARACPAGPPMTGPAGLA